MQLYPCLLGTRAYPLPALQGAIECLTAKLVGAGSAPNPGTARDAENCMRDVGMSMR